mmetsp:Transcript_20206/g.22711  ORF Transcript_20206/g.22711 Transcript_20206/m.22711 type:complete len:1237 (-) Transcript_20206:127-3837(-)
MDHDEVTTSSSNDVLIGPDLNPTRSPFDKKNYRQILLPNGLRALLVSDVVAMTQAYNIGGGLMYDDDEDDSSSDDDDEMEVDDSPDVDEDDDDDDDSSSDEDKDNVEEDENCGLRNAAAAMIVGTGSLYDPPECQGMAHFLEHLLFMGSEKYPEENSYDAFMSKHGGNDNAYTESEHTVYHFEIPQEHLGGALDLFSQFFISPLLRESSVERELKAIESEFMLAKNSDGSRSQQLMAYTCGRSSQEHPFSKFGWGNHHSLKTLPERDGHDPLKMLLSFYEEHHYASNMRLVVIGGYPLDYLEEQVVKCCSGIRSKDIPGSYRWDQLKESPMRSNGPPLAESSLKKIYYIAPVKDRNSISVTWQIPTQIANWKAKPCDYLAHLIGHEGAGSLLASLKSKSWAIHLFAGVGDEGDENATGHALFSVSITLSAKGVKYWREVVSELYQYVGMLRHYCHQTSSTEGEGGLPPWIYEEIRSMYEIAHRYADEEPPEDFAVDLAEEMSPWFNTPPERLLDASGLLFEYDPETVQNLLDEYFTPCNSRVDLASSIYGRSGDYESSFPIIDYYNNFDPNKDCLPPSDEAFDPSKNTPSIEPIFGTPFWIQSIDKKTLEGWAQLAKPQLPPSVSMLCLPEQNEFVPSDFSLKPLPPADCSHPLLNCSIKLQIPVGKRKEWFPATVTQYNANKNQILCAYEDEDKKWHQMDAPKSELQHDKLTSPDFEGSLDKRKIKYRIVSFAMEGERANLKFGDESDFDVEDGKSFPAIPPMSPASRLPKLVVNTNELKLWHVQDRVFKRPIAELRLQLNCAEANKSILHSVCADILVNLVCDNLTETSYMASVCEIGSSLSTNDRGLSMRVHGFNDKLMNLFVIIFETLLKFRNNQKQDLPEGFCKQRFALILENYRRSCHNSGLKAQNLASGTRIRCICERTFSSREKLDVIESIDVPTFTTTVSNLLNKIGVEGLHTGNVDAEAAHQVRDKVLAMLKKSCSGNCSLSRKKYPSQFVLKLPPKTYELTCVTKDPTESNAAVEIYLQVGKDNVNDRVMVDLLMEIMNEPLYNQIRTKDQFGYHVSCDSRWTNGVIGIHISVVSAVKTVKEIKDRIERFLFEFRQTLLDMSKEDFMGHLVGLAKEKLNMFNSLSEETSHIWGEIRDGRYVWEMEIIELRYLKSITKEQTLKAYDQWIFPENKKRRQLIVQVVASEGPASFGRPDVNADGAEKYIDSCVDSFHAFCKHQTFGKIY